MVIPFCLFIFEPLGFQSKYQQEDEGEGTLSRFLTPFVATMNCVVKSIAMGPLSWDVTLFRSTVPCPSSLGSFICYVSPAFQGGPLTCFLKNVTSEPCRYLILPSFPTCLSTYTLVQSPSRLHSGFDSQWIFAGDFWDLSPPTPFSCPFSTVHSWLSIQYQTSIKCGTC